MKRYEIEYDNAPLATVDIDESRALAMLREMVEFWMGWQKNLADHKGDYARAWLRLLAKFILNHQRLPNDDEGWVPLDGTHGIWVIEWQQWQPDEDLITYE